MSNFASHRQTDILAQPILLRSVRDSLMHPSASVREAAVRCVHNLVRDRIHHKELREAEIDATLRGLVHSRLPFGSPLPTSASPMLSAYTPASVGADSKDIHELAKDVLNSIDMGR